ncbi:MAG: hypothetical protein NTV11_19570 [Rhodocyclales bacterium]|nr:hypothetical protein [Rhodocyclales bacterium]
MARGERWDHASMFGAQVALAAIKGENTGETRAASGGSDGFVRDIFLNSLRLILRPRVAGICNKVRKKSLQLCVNAFALRNDNQNNLDNRHSVKGVPRMLYVLLIAALLSGESAWSYDPIPSGAEKIAPPQKQAGHAKKPTTKDHCGTEKAPLFVKVVDCPQTEANATENENQHGDKPARIWRMAAEDATAIFTGFLVGIGALAAAVLLWQANLLRRSVDLARDEFISTHRPRVVLRDVRIVPPAHERDENAYIKYTLANIGDTAATIVELHVRPLENDITDPLTPPPPLPVEGAINVSVSLETCTEFTDSVDSLFRYVVLTECPEQMTSRLWFMGKVIYRDRKERRRATAFCCYFDPRIRRFRTLSGKEATGYEYES